MQIGQESPEPIRQIHVLGRTGMDVILPVTRRPATQAPFQRWTGAQWLASVKSVSPRQGGLTVGLIGLGGVGSMVARRLAGVVGELVLIDPDHLEPHNAPRVWFAGVRSSGSKVGAAKRALR